MQSHAFTSTSSSSTSLPHRRTPSSNRLSLHQSVPSNASFPSKSIDFEAVTSISGYSLRRLPSICRSSSSKLTGWISTPPPDVPENETDGVEVRAAAVTDTAGEAVNRKKSSLVSLLELGALFGFWFVFNIYFNIYNKQVLDVYPFPITLSMLQFAVGTVLVILMWTLNLHKRPKISGSQLAAIFPLALVHTLGNLTLNMSLGKVSVSFTHTIKALEPFFSVFLSAMFLGEAPTIWVVSSLVPIVGGVVLASLTEASFNWVGFWSAMASNLSNQSRNVLSKKFMVRKEDSLDNITLFSIITLMSFALNIPITLLVEGIKFTPSYMQSTGLNVSQVCNWSLLACICFHAYQQVAYMILERVSLVTHSVGNCVKRVVVIVSSVLFFRTPVCPFNALGTGVALTGVFLYSRIRNIKPKQKTALGILLLLLLLLLLILLLPPYYLLRRVDIFLSFCWKLRGIVSKFK